MDTLPQLSGDKGEIFPLRAVRDLLFRDGKLPVKVDQRHLTLVLLVIQNDHISRSVAGNIDRLPCPAAKIGYFIGAVAQIGYWTNTRHRATSCHQ